MNMSRLMETLKRHEGVRAKPYADTEGILTIGVGRNLEDVGLRPDEIDKMLWNDIQSAVADAKQVFPNWHDLSERRKEVCVNMAFNLGRNRLLGFRKMIAAVENGDWTEAAAQMLDSRWAEQVGKRSTELAKWMLEG